ncbi:hypothetical protein CYMTET_42103, partial [Cymbomonas tetramitiformis]
DRLKDGMPMYSHGVRQRLQLRYSNESDMFISRSGGNSLKAVFCLAPAGLGFGVRVAHSVADGCIPVIIQDNVTQPYEGDFLPYSLFSVRIAEADIERTREILLEYTSEDIRNFRREAACAWPYMLWSSVYGAFGTEDGRHDAFHALLSILRRRRDGESFQERSLCSKASSGMVNGVGGGDPHNPIRPVCHMYCDAYPAMAPDIPQCAHSSKDVMVCQTRKFQPIWQPWPSGGALQT